MVLQLNYCDNNLLLSNVYFPCNGYSGYMVEINIVCGFIESVLLEVMKFDVLIILATDSKQDALKKNKM